MLDCKHWTSLLTGTKGRAGTANRRQSLISTIACSNCYLGLRAAVSFKFMNILSNSWCDGECTGVLQSLSCKMPRKFCFREREDNHHTSILIFAILNLTSDRKRFLLVER